MRKNFLDGLRGWASLMVVFSHLMPRLLTDLTPEYDKFYFRFMTDGALAIYIFFVLSGFALSVKFVETRNTHVLTRSAAARYFRLAIPILGASLVGHALLTAGLMSHIEVAPLFNSKDWLGTFYNFESTLPWVLQFSFYNVLADYNGLQSYSPALWTMPIEFIGSFLVLGYCALFGKQTQASGSLPVMPFVIGIILLLLYVPIYSCFIIGYLLAELFADSRLRDSRWVQVLAGVLFAVPVICSTWFRTDSEPLMVLQATTVVFAVSFSPWLRRFFSSRVSEFLGRISFPLYLIHFAVICSFTSSLYLWLHDKPLSNWTISNITLISSVAVALLAAWLFLPVEKFSIKASRSFAEFLLKFRY
jgi:peptidoglycan/LPS O-acetylase OafA/YrhL